MTEHAEPMEVEKNEKTKKNPKISQTPQTPETPAPSGNVPDKVETGLPEKAPAAKTAAVATKVSPPSGLPAAAPGPWTLTRYVVKHGFSKSIYTCDIVYIICFFVPAPKQLCITGTLVNMANESFRT